MSGGNQIGEQNPGNAYIGTSIVEGGWTGPGSTILTADPQFVLPRDFHIGLTSPAVDVTSGGLFCSVDPFDADNQIRDCANMMTEIGADDCQPITYVTGSPQPFGTVFLNVAGAAPLQPVLMVVGFQLAEPPIATTFGLLEVADPTPIFVVAPATDADGASSLPQTLGAVPVGLDIVVQALVGIELAGGTTMQIQ